MSRAERITTVADVGAAAPASIRGLARQVRPVSLGVERTLPLDPGLETLVPAGIRRGSTVVVAGATHSHGATTLAFALGAAVSRQGGWCAAVGLADLGVAAVGALGLDLARTALIPHVDPRHWMAVVGAALDAVDLAVIRPPAHLRPGDARRARQRARERGVVLVVVVDRRHHGQGRDCWAEGAEVRLSVSGSDWHGAGAGEGRLLGRRVTVTTGGRGVAARERSVALWLPAPDGAIRGAQPDAYAGSDVDLLPDPQLDAGPAGSGLRSTG